MLGNDFVNIIRLNHAVECAVGMNDNNRAESTKAEATCLYKLYFFSEAVLFKRSNKLLVDFLAA